MKGTTCMTYHLSEEAIRTRFHDAIRSTKQGKYGNEVIPGERAGLCPTGLACRLQGAVRERQWEG